MITWGTQKPQVASFSHAFCRQGGAHLSIVCCMMKSLVDGSGVLQIASSTPWEDIRYTSYCRNSGIVSVSVSMLASTGYGLGCYMESTRLSCRIFFQIYCCMSSLKGGRILPYRIHPVLWVLSLSIADLAVGVEKTRIMMHATKAREGRSSSPTL